MVMRIFNPRISIYSLIKGYIGHESSCEAIHGHQMVPSYFLVWREHHLLLLWYGLAVRLLATHAGGPGFNPRAVGNIFT